MSNWSRKCAGVLAGGAGLGIWHGKQNERHGGWGSFRAALVGSSVMRVFGTHTSWSVNWTHTHTHSRSKVDTDSNCGPRLGLAVIHKCLGELEIFKFCHRWTWNSIEFCSRSYQPEAWWTPTRPRTCISALSDASCGGVPRCGFWSDQPARLENLIIGLSRASPWGYATHKGVHEREIRVSSSRSLLWCDETGTLTILQYQFTKVTHTGSWQPCIQWIKKEKNKELNFKRTVLYMISMPVPGRT